MNFDELALQLSYRNFVVSPSFIPDEIVSSLRLDLRKQLQQGHFRLAGVGPLHNRQQSEIRRDQILWLDPMSTNVDQQPIWIILESLRLALNRTLFLGLEQFEGHYSVYPEGGYYSRHLDNFNSSSERIVSFVLYLNEDWQPMNGGHLRVYDGDVSVDIEPAGGTLVLFLSRELEHEVLSSHTQRFSFTGWFKARRIAGVL